MPPELYAEVSAFFTVIFADLVLAGDNAIVVGMAAAGLPPYMRRKAIIIGIGAAALLRIVFALFATQLLNVIGVLIVGGLLLLWVCWKLWRELHGSHFHAHTTPDHDAHCLPTHDLPGGARAARHAKTLRQALSQIVLADVSMSLDNVLVVAGVARHHPWVLVFGLALSVALMGLAASLIAKVLHRYPWISYLGLVLIAWVALSMIWEGSWIAWHGMVPHPPPPLPA